MQILFACMHFRIMENLNKIKTDALIVDVCSSKELYCKARNCKRLRMIGGHPMAGNEHKGEKGWNPELFRNAPFFLCPAGIASRSHRIRSCGS